VTTQLRPFYTDEELATVYHRPYDHTRWDEHRRRVAATVDIVTRWGKDRGWYDGIDLTCGDGAILRALVANGTVQTAYYGDLVHADHLDVVGRVEDTLPAHTVLGRPRDLYVCSETLEHLRDPAGLLENARALASHMVLTTPVDETAAHENAEHYWSWSVEDVRDMLELAGWTVQGLDLLAMDHYVYQVWCCS
jgi:hypothetical protein